jgi:hypothetical protein
MSKSECNFPLPLHSPNTRSSGVQDERDEKMVAANALPSPRVVMWQQRVKRLEFDVSAEINNLEITVERQVYLIVTYLL